KLRLYGNPAFNVYTGLEIFANSSILAFCDSVDYHVIYSQSCPQASQISPAAKQLDCKPFVSGHSIKLRRTLRQQVDDLEIYVMLQKRGQGKVKTLNRIFDKQTKHLMRLELHLPRSCGPAIDDLMHQRPLI